MVWIIILGEEGTRARERPLCDCGGRERVTQKLLLRVQWFPSYHVPLLATQMWSGIYCLHLNQVLYGNLCTIPLQNIAEKFTYWKTHSATFRQFWGQLPLLWCISSFEAIGILWEKRLYQSRDSGLLQQTRAWLIAACKRQNAFITFLPLHRRRWTAHWRGYKSPCTWNHGIHVVCACANHGYQATLSSSPTWPGYT